MSILYNIGILVYNLLVKLASLFNGKAALWVEGRKEWQKKISEKISPEDNVIWIHCASLGEFEQGRPLIEELKKARPGYKIALTFFSPSGYEIRKNYAEVDCVSYLPLDTISNANEFVRLVHPTIAIFVKYEFWSNYILALGRQNIPLYLVSGIFRPGQHFFKWYGSYFRSLLGKFEMIFVQDNESMNLLTGIGISRVRVAGDTRFDRVLKIASSAKDIPAIESFRNGERLFLAGSSWEPDEEIMARYINLYPDRMKWVFAPHEIHLGNIERLEKLFRVKTVRFSTYDNNSSEARVMIIDNIGMLSSAYRYATIAGIGGGFGKGIHNILEAACWGIPVMFGPKHEKFREAVELINLKGAMSFNTFEKFKEILNGLLKDEKNYLTSSQEASLYIKKNTGATDIILADIFLKI